MKGNKLARDIEVLAEFVEVFCVNKHSARDKSQWKSTSKEIEWKGNKDPLLCKECCELLNYAVMRRSLCPLDPKPPCKKCKIHCYSKEYRSKIREVMKFSGIYLIKHCRFDLILHFF